jgi:hypothetical protein
VNVALAELKWTVHARDGHGMIDPNVLAKGRHVLEFRGETVGACEDRVADVVARLVEAMKEDGVEVRVAAERTQVQPPPLRGMR